MHVEQQQQLQQRLQLREQLVSHRRPEAELRDVALIKATNAGTKRKVGAAGRERERERGGSTVRGNGNGTSPNQSKFMQLLSPFVPPLLLPSSCFL